MPHDERSDAPLCPRVPMILRRPAFSDSNELASIHTRPGRLVTPMTGSPFDRQEPTRCTLGPQGRFNALRLP